MAKQKNDCTGLVEKKCKKCGRIFIPAPLHRYRDERSGYYCSWTCYNHRKDPKTKTKTTGGDSNDKGTT